MVNKQEYIRERSHVAPLELKVGPISLILYHTVPDPSKAAAVVGAFAM
jgi:hypothetical protein